MISFIAILSAAFLAARPDICFGMSFWRPSDNCIYVISDINGMHNELELILSRILPLRKTGNNKDKLIFLGNYMGSSFSPNTIDLIINAKKENRIICLCGDHDLKLLKSMSSDSDSGSNYSSWLKSGGDLSLIGYQKRIGGGPDNPYLITRQNLSRFIPQEHINFISSLDIYHEMNDYIFVHGGCDPYQSLFCQQPEVLINDRSVFTRCNSTENFKCPWEKTIVTGGVGKLDGKPLILDKFITLDGSYAERLYVMELNSMELFSARKGKSRLVKESIT